MAFSTYILRISIFTTIFLLFYSIIFYLFGNAFGYLTIALLLVVLAIARYYNPKLLDLISFKKTLQPEDLTKYEQWIEQKKKTNLILGLVIPILFVVQAIPHFFRKPVDISFPLPIIVMLWFFIVILIMVITFFTRRIIHNSSSYKQYLSKSIILGIVVGISAVVILIPIIIISVILSL